MNEDEDYLTHREVNMITNDAYMSFLARPMIVWLPLWELGISYEPGDQYKRKCINCEQFQPAGLISDLHCVESAFIDNVYIAAGVKHRNAEDRGFCSLSCYNYWVETHRAEICLVFAGQG